MKFGRPSVRAGIPRTLLTFLLPLILLAFATPAVAQSTTDLIRGRVSRADSSSVSNVIVTVLSVLTETVRTTRTDTSGRYTVVFPNGGGNYIVSYNLIGHLPVVRQVRRMHDETLLVSDVQMQLAPMVLSSVIITGNAPERRAADLPDSTGSFDHITGSGLTLGDMGNLLLMAAQLPGVTLVTDDDGRPIGLSVLGLGADQNQMTVDGVKQNIGDLPTEGMPSATITTTTSDPSKGGFSGANVAVNTKPGTWQVTRSLGLTVDEPRLQFSDPAGMQLGREYTNLQLSGESSGPIVLNWLTYKGSFQYGHRTNGRATMLNTGSAGFEEIGASIDSVFRLRSAMEEVGIPFNAPGIPRSQLAQSGTMMLRTDFTPPGTHALNATVNASWKNQTSSSSPLMAPARGGDTESISASGQINHSTYFPFQILTETKLAYSVSNSATGAYVDLPDARVRVRSVNSEGKSTLANFQLGGNSAMPVTTRNTKWEFINGLSWASKDNAHRIKFGTELRLDEYSQTQKANRLGTFTFNSLADFTNGRPSDFRRQLTEVHKGADLFTVAFSLGDQWRKTKDLNFQYGIRVELDRYGARPTYNPKVEELFGARNDHAPNDIHFIPRFGFTYSYGVAPQIAAFEGAARGPRATWKGTLGEYRNTPSNSLLQQAMGSTGLPNDIQILSCSGDAAPTPDWRAFAQDLESIPEMCADGTGSTVFSDRQPAVLLFDRGYQPERSWRADLGWSGTALRRYRFSATGLYSLNIVQTGNVDLNFTDRMRFILSNEQGRPVYVRPTSISTRSGSVATSDARLSTEFGKVTERRSDLQSATAQLNMSISPVVVSPKGVKWSLNYVYQNVHEFRRGFGGTASVDPLTRSWVPARGALHQISTSLNYKLLGFNLGLSARLSSGARYTPMIRGDVNGDGESNDRAMVFNPATSPDTALASAMQTLLESAPSGARDCLRRQIGRIAATNSCVGPWSSTINVSLSLDPKKLVLPGRTTLQMSFGNPMTGLDLLLTGEANERQWGQQNGNPDATLLYVRGFDAERQQFRYEVNPEFGSSRASRASQARPFLVTLRFSTDISPPLEKQKLKRDITSWEAGTARRPNEATLKRQYMQTFTSMFESIVKQRDTLGLSAEQGDSVAAMTASYVARIDSIWTPMARDMASGEISGGVDAVHSRMQGLRRQSFMLMADMAQAVKAVLSKEQFNRLPESYGIYFDEARVRRMR